MARSTPRTKFQDRSGEARRLQGLYFRFERGLLRRLRKFIAQLFPKQPDLSARDGRLIKLDTDHDLIHRGIVVIGKIHRTCRYVALRHHSSACTCLRIWEWLLWEWPAGRWAHHFYKIGRYSSLTRSRSHFWNAFRSDEELCKTTIRHNHRIS